VGRCIGAPRHPAVERRLSSGVWAVSDGKHLRRRDARQAFSLQCVFLAVWIVLVGLMMFAAIKTSVLLGVLGLGFVVELPQVGRALAGRPPFRIVLLEVLPS